MNLSCLIFDLYFIFYRCIYSWQNRVASGVWLHLWLNARYLQVLILQKWKYQGGFILFFYKNNPYPAGTSIGFFYGEISCLIMLNKKTEPLQAPFFEFKCFIISWLSLLFVGIPPGWVGVFPDENRRLFRC